MCFIKISLETKKPSLGSFQFDATYILCAGKKGILRMEQST